MLLQYILVHAVTMFHIYLIVYICFISSFTEKSQNEGKETRERGSHLHSESKQTECRVMSRVELHACISAHGGRMHYPKQSCAT